MSDNQQQTTSVSDVHVEVKENHTQGKELVIIVIDMFISYC
jgi:hypothetical protein